MKAPHFLLIFGFMVGEKTPEKAAKQSFFRGFSPM
jgi:hypothetical protein